MAIMGFTRHAGCRLPLLLVALQLALSSSFAVAQRVRVCGTPEMSFSAAQTIQTQLNATMVRTALPSLLDLHTPSLRASLAFAANVSAAA